MSFNINKTGSVLLLSFVMVRSGKGNETTIKYRALKLFYNRNGGGGGVISLS
jgi:hypothetical protein